MKILQVISHYVPAYRFGGPLQVAHSLGKALVRRGHEVTVCCTNLRDQEADLDLEVDQPIDVDGVTVYYETVTRFRRWGYSPGMSQRILDLLPNFDFVLVHNHFQYAGWIGARHARACGKPYIIFPHASLRRQSILSSSGLAKGLYLWFFDRENYRRADYVAFNAEEEQDDSLFRRQGTLVPNGIHPDDFDVLPARGRFRATDPRITDKLVFLFLGRMDIRQKALDVMLEAFATRVRSGSESVLILAGPSEGRDQDKLRALAGKLHVDDRVIFTGLVSGRDKMELLRDADVFLMPSRYEGLSMSLLEAMAAGLPIILSDRCGLHREIVRMNCGRVVQPEAKSVAEAMAAFEDAENRICCGARARELALTDFTWPRIAERVEALIQTGLCDD